MKNAVLILAIFICPLFSFAQELTADSLGALTSVNGVFFSNAIFEIFKRRRND